MSSFSARSNSRATTSFCWFPPDSVPAETLGRWGADVVPRDALGGRFLDGREVAQDAVRERFAVVARQDHVVRQGERQDQAEPVAIGRHVGDPRLVHRPRAVRRHVVAGQLDPAACDLAQPDDRLDELVLPVARDAGDPEDLARADLEVDATDSRVATVVRDLQTGHLQDRGRGMRCAPVDRQLDGPPDHEFGEIVLVRLGRDALADHLAPPDDRDPVRDLEDFVELVADEQDAVTLGRQPAQDLEDLLGLLRCQDRGRLVEHEDSRIAVEGLEDLDPLLPADGQRADLGVGIDLEAEAFAELPDPAARFLSVEEDRVGHRLVAEEDVLGDGEDRDQHEVLVDHVDPASDRVRRTGDVDRFAVEQDLPLVRPGKAVQDVHQGRLAGAVLAEQGVDLTGLDVEVDRVVRDHARIALRDAAHLESGGSNRVVRAGHRRCDPRSG